MPIRHMSIKRVRRDQRLPATVKHDIAADSVHSIYEDALGALSAGKLGAGEPEHMSCTPGLVDARGRRESIKLLNRTLDRLIAIQRASNCRMTKSGEERPSSAGEGASAGEDGV